jgi:hypothetical protein
MGGLGVLVVTAFLALGAEAKPQAALQVQKRKHIVFIYLFVCLFVCLFVNLFLFVN